VTTATRADETGRTIVRAAWTLLTQHAYGDITLRAIADKAGVSPPLTVKYFGGKEQSVAHTLSFEEDTRELLDAPLDGLGRHH
jgi:AcrR family transcriptional regulator